MRLLVIIALTSLLLPLQAPLVHAEEKYKGKPARPDDQGQYKKPPADRPQPPTPKPPVYKPPPPPPDNRPPIKGHEDKKPPYQPPDDPRKKPIVPPPPPGRPVVPQPPQPQPWPPHDRWCPPTPCPQPIVLPPPDPLPPPVDMYIVLTRKVNMMALEGFVGDVVVGFDRRIEFIQTLGGGRAYHIGSATEAFTAWAMYRLVYDGSLKLSTTLGEVFPQAPADKREITIEQLLGHNSGLGNTFAADGEGGRDAAIEQLLSQPLQHTPGGDYFHSDDGYVLLAAVIEVASRMRYEEYILDRGIIDRSMRSTFFWEERNASNWGMRGSEGIFSTAIDLYVWASRFMGQPGDMTNEIMRPRFRADSGEGIGFGWVSWADSDWSPYWASGTCESKDNVVVVVYPAGAVLAVTSDRYHGDVPWSERVANTLEPVLRDWAPREGNDIRRMVSTSSR